MASKGRIKKLDDLCREIVRLRDKNTCQHCGKYVTGVNSHCSHVVPKSKGYVLRWDLRNLKVLCFHCHINWWHKNPREAGAWFDDTFPERAKYIDEHKEDIIHGSIREEFMSNKLEELKDELARFKD